jgi:hypothetical protein
MQLRYEAPLMNRFTSAWRSILADTSCHHRDPARWVIVIFTRRRTRVILLLLILSVALLYGLGLTSLEGIRAFGGLLWSE